MMIYRCHTDDYRMILSNETTFATGNGRFKKPTLWERHLQAVYEDRVAEAEGLEFFATCGYDDEDDSANSVDAFRQRLGLDAYWINVTSTTEAERVVEGLMGIQAILPNVAKPTLWELHLRAVYDRKADEVDGLTFFASHGYFDTDEDECSPVHVFVKHVVGLEPFWGVDW
ncbi:hypothetical protein BBJ28_00011942 [Nothophytophthora sp. Chile5]|nr:hypothetical protein BBJ28_00011942 [Nothophytophthora sp. Chile5]